MDFDDNFLRGERVHRAPLYTAVRVTHVYTPIQINRRHTSVEKFNLETHEKNITWGNIRHAVELPRGSRHRPCRS